jgi:putative tryptophan/tyrosine transport system substrate-binding protein
MASCFLYKRREFISLLGGAAAAWPFAARAQQPSMPLIGFLHGGSAEANQGFTSTFRQGLKQTGFSEGQNLAIEFRWADGHYDRLPALASDLIGRQPTVIVAAGGDNSARAAIAATTTIPIVFVAGSDPSKSGLVRSLNKPGGNATGVSIFSTEVVGKRLDLLHELMPDATVIGMFVNPNNPNADTQIRGAQEAALARGVGLDVVNVGDDRDFDPAFARLLERRIEAVVVGADPIFFTKRYQLVALAARHALPAIFENREFTRAGGLMSYGTSVPDVYRQAGIYAGSILKGKKPDDLPVLLPAKFVLAINLQTAKALGREFPPTLLVLADEVIE